MVFRLAPYNHFRISRDSVRGKKPLDVKVKIKQGQHKSALSLFYFKSVPKGI